MSDILNTLGKKDSSNVAQEAAKADSHSEVNTAAADTAKEMARGDDLIGKLNNTGSGPDNAAKSEQSKSAMGDDPKASSDKVEPYGENESKSTPKGDEWTTESALREIKKLREENKAYRLKYSEQLDSLKKEAESKVQKKDSEVQELLQAKKELDELKAKEADKKRNAEEKLAHREAKLQEFDSLIRQKETEYESKIAELQEKLMVLEADREAELKVWSSRLEEELSNIPETFKEYAKLIVKGAGDAKDALIAVQEAKLRGMFEDKTVIVNHSVPGASDGARANKERIEEGEKAHRNKLSPSQKIRDALAQVSRGTPNSAFRTK